MATDAAEGDAEIARKLALEHEPRLLALEHLVGFLLSEAHRNHPFEFEDEIRSKRLALQEVRRQRPNDVLSIAALLLVLRELGDGETPPDADQSPQVVPLRPPP